MAGYFCDRCELAFDAPEPRCPRCLRKSSVRSQEELVTDELPGTEPTGVPLGLRLGFILAACAQWIVIAGVLVWAWDGLGQLHLDVPAAVALALGATTAIRLAGRMEADAERPWGSFGRWMGGATLAALWVFVSGGIAEAMTRELSALVTLVLAVGIFFAGAVPAFTWALRREVAAEARAQSPR